MLAPLSMAALRRLPDPDRNGKGGPLPPNPSAEEMLRAEVTRTPPAVVSDVMGGAAGMPSVNPEAVVTAQAPLRMPDAPTFGSSTAYMEQKPEARNVRPQRNAQLVASLLGLGAAAVGGPSAAPVWGGLAALGQGVATGAGTSADTIQAEDETRRQAYIRGLTDIMSAETRGRVDVYGDQVSAYNNQQDEIGLDRRNAADNQRARENNTRDNERAYETAALSEAGDVFDTAIKNGNVEAAVAAAESIGMDPAAARSLAEASNRAIREAEAIKRGELSVRERRLVIDQEKTRLGWYNATKPPAARTSAAGTGTTTSGRTVSADMIGYMRRMLEDSNPQWADVARRTFRDAYGMEWDDYLAEASGGASANGPAPAGSQGSPAVLAARNKYTTLLQSGSPLPYIIESVDNDRDLTPQQRDEIADELSRLLTGQ